MLKQRHILTVSDQILVAAFLIAVGLPWLDTWRNAVSVDNMTTEPVRSPRPPSELVTISPIAGAEMDTAVSNYKTGGSCVSRLIAIGRLVKRYLRQHYGAKDFMLRQGAYIRVSIFGQSPNRNVIIGKSGWLFYYNEEIREMFHNNTLASASHVRIWKDYFLREARAASSVGALYCVVICPNKASIYPEFLPDTLPHAQAAKITDAIIQSIEDAPNISVLDLRPVLREEKQRGRLFHKTDTHWNELGGFVASQAIERMIRDRLQGGVTIDISNYTISVRKENGLDLARLIGLDKVVQEECIIVRHTSEHLSWLAEWVSSEDGKKIRGRCKTKSAIGRIPRSVIARDSFSVALFPYLAPLFKEAYWLRVEELDEKSLGDIRPVVVFRIMVERRFANDTVVMPH